MRSSRASSVREAERRRKTETDQHNRRAGSTSIDPHSVRRQDRLDSGVGSAYAAESNHCSPACAAQPPVPSVIFTSTSGLISSPVCGTCNGPSMNTLAAQTAACSGGSSFSINTPAPCECGRGNGGTRITIDGDPYCDGGREDDPFCTPQGSLRTEREMRWELRYFFMNPYLKFKKRGRKPWKLSIQVIKIFLVTTQLIFFGLSNNSLNEFYEGNREAFEHLFLDGWDTAYDSEAYPRSDQLYAIYELQSFYDHLDHVAYQFAHLKQNALGTYGYDHRDGEVCKLHVWQENYVKINISDDGIFCLNLSTTQESLVINVSRSQNVSVKEYLHEHNQTIDSDRLILFKLNFVIGSLHLRDLKTVNIPDCIRFNITIEYDNRAHNGRLPIALKVKHDFFNNCSFTTKRINDQDSRQANMYLALDVVIIVLCVLSAIMCVRSFGRAQHLKLKTARFFKKNYHVELSLSDRLEFLNLWYVLIIVNDACTIAGSINKILIEFRNNTNYDTCSLLLGMGCFLVWFGVLRYLSFFHKYNILILTLKTAMPHVLRFLLCAGIIYAAYAFFGWIVLGPYHPKFRTLEISIECMYSLINGDDMYATFREMSDRNQVIYVFSRIYLFTFISLFIYVVLSLIIAVIMDTYETIKEYQRTGHVEGRLRSFMAETCDDAIPGRGSFHTQSSLFERSRSLWRDKFKRAVCCRRCRSQDDGADDDDGLIT